MQATAENPDLPYVDLDYVSLEVWEGKRLVYKDTSGPPPIPEDELQIWLVKCYNCGFQKTHMGIRAQNEVEAAAIYNGWHQYSNRNCSGIPQVIPYTQIQECLDLPQTTLWEKIQYRRFHKGKILFMSIYSERKINPKTTEIQVNEYYAEYAVENRLNIYHSFDPRWDTSVQSWY